MKKPEGADADLGMPAADELWPRRTGTDADIDEAETAAHEQDTFLLAGDELPRPATLRTASMVIKPPTFPVAPPIPPLSLPVTPPVAAQADSQGPPTIIEGTQADAARLTSPPPGPTPRPAVPAEPPIFMPPPIGSPRSRGAYRSSTYGPGVLEQVLRSAAARGAATVYLRAGVETWIRAHGELQVLDGTPVLASDELEMLLVALRLAHDTAPRRLFTASEWSFNLDEVGHVRCTTFKDDRGVGGMFEIAPFRVSLTDQIGLSLDVQRLASEREGLIIVSGPRGSAKLRLMYQLAHLITRSRRAYVIAVQRGMGIRAANDDPSISQREVREGLDDMLAVVRAALRENPDVLLLDNARSAPLLNLALDAAASGQLVIAAITAPSAIGALERLVDLYAPEQGRAVQLQLAQHVRAIVGQVLVPKTRSGGFVAAQEVMLMTSAIAAVLAEGRAYHLRAALESGPSSGMVPLGDGLLALVRAGEVRPEDAYRRAPDPAALLERFERHGIDTSFAQR